VEEERGGVIRHLQLYQEVKDGRGGGRGMINQVGWVKQRAVNGRFCSRTRREFQAKKMRVFSVLKRMAEYLARSNDKEMDCKKKKSFKKSASRPRRGG